MAGWMDVSRETKDSLPTMLVQAIGIATAMCVCELVSAPVMVTLVSGAFNILPWFVVACLFAVAFTYTVGFALIWAVDAFARRVHTQWMPLVYCLAGGVGFYIWGYTVYPSAINAILVPAGLSALSQSGTTFIGINCAIVGVVSFFLGTSVASRLSMRKRVVISAGVISIVLAALGGIVLGLTLYQVS